jgi:GntR family transcriptional regulator
MQAKYGFHVRRQGEPGTVDLVGYQGPLWRAIREDLRHKISVGFYPPGSKLPSTRELADQYETSPVTVRRAVDSMIELGELPGKQGVGVFVPLDSTT